jgi:hypothetical protein
MSWINPVTGLPEVDKGGDPGDQPWRPTILGEKVYRFAHLLEAYINVDNNNKIVGQGFSSSTSSGKGNGMYRSPSYMKFSSEPLAIQNSIHHGGDFVRFVQRVGCSTKSPEKIGKVGGVVVGFFAYNPLGLVVWVAAGAAGNAVAHAVKGFPPIWTELELTIHNDGRYTGQVLRYSLFPSHNFYLLDLNKPKVPILSNLIMTMAPIGYTLFSKYDGVPQLTHWDKDGWGPVNGKSGACEGNPWNVTKWW